MAETKKRIFTLSKPYVSQAYRAKIRAWNLSEGVESTLICPPSWGDLPFEAEPASLTPLDIRICPIVANGKNHFFFYRGLSKIFSTVRPDILNVEEEHYSLVTYQCLRWAKKLKVPMTFYTWQNIEKKYPWPFSFFEKEVFSYCKLAFAGNQEARDILKRKGFKGEIVVVPQMGYDPEIFYSKFSKPREGNETGFVIGYAGRLVEEKGLSTLVTSFHQLLARGRNVRLIIAGNGPYKGEVTHRLDLEIKKGRASIVSQIPSGDMASLLQSLDVLVLPSLTKANWKEQFGRILVEAMACETVVVGSNSGEIPHVIHCPELIFKEGDAHSLSEVLEPLVLDPHKVRSLGKQLREHAERNYSNNVIADIQLKALKSQLYDA